MSSNSHETRFSKNIRGLISFVLFLLIVLLSLSACARLSFLNEETIEKQFTGYAYTSALRDDVADYVKDVCTLNGISDDNVDEIFSYGTVSEAVKAYYGFYISDKIEYSEESYKNQIDNICNEFMISIQTQLDEDGVKYDKNSVNTIADSINEYFVNTVELPHMDKIKSVFSVGNIALYAVIGVSTFFVLALMLIEFFVGTKRQRSVRAISMSFLTAGIYELLLALIIYIVSLIKHVDVFPVYLSQQFLSYIYTALANVAFCGTMLILVSIIIMIVVWKMRKED